MKKIIVLLVGLFAVSFSLMSQANILVMTNSADACSSLQGQWTGKASLKMGPVHCTYEGRGTIDLVGDNQFNTSLTVTKGSGMGCPNLTGEIIPTQTGTCQGNIISMQVIDVVLTGTADPQHMSLTGSITNPLPADLSLTLDKVSS